MAKQVFRIPATWTVRGEVVVEADSLDDAKERAMDAPYSAYENVEPVEDTYKLDKDTLKDNHPDGAGTFSDMPACEEPVPDTSPLEFATDGPEDIPIRDRDLVGESAQDRENAGSTLLIWEEVPENMTLYVIPNDKLTLEQVAFFENAHGHMINAVDDSKFPGLKYLNHALSTSEPWEDDGFEKYTGELAEYKVFVSDVKEEDEHNDPLVGQHITRVFCSGFMQ